MKTPVILSYTTLKKSGELNEAYAKAISDAGGELKMLSSMEQIDEEIGGADGVHLPGGSDVNPQLYGEERNSHTQPPHDERDRFEMYLIEKAMDRKLPILGICRGLQVLNVKFGGNLYQDVEKEMSGSIRHDWHEDNSIPLSRSAHAHSISLTEDSKLHELFKEDQFEVNSLHHQGIKELGSGLVATGHAPDGLIEAIEMPTYPYLVGVQWHPEELQAEPMWQSFIEDFVRACKK